MFIVKLMAGGDGRKPLDVLQIEIIYLALSIPDGSGGDPPKERDRRSKK